VSSDITESIKFFNVSATTPTFQLKGGRYSLIVSGTFGGGNVQLQTLSADGTTWVGLGTSITSATNQSYDLPPASYRLAIVTATAVYASLTSVPL
jgi:hypothetical protein